MDTPQPCAVTCWSNSTLAISQRYCVSITTDRNALYSARDGGPSCRTNRENRRAEPIVLLPQSTRVQRAQTVPPTFDDHCKKTCEY